jgi:hypothetical protein
MIIDANAPKLLRISALAIVLLVIAALIGASLGLIGLWAILNEPEIRFVVPNGFRGGFIIVEDSNGVDLGGPFSRTYLVRVPVSRVVKVKSFARLQSWHRPSIQTGENEPVSMVNLDPPDNAIEMRLGGTCEGFIGGVKYRERTYYFIGTAAEAAGFDPYSIAADPSERTLPENQISD